MARSARLDQSRHAATEAEPRCCAPTIRGRSVIDAYSFPMIRWAKKLLPGGLSAYPNVQALHDRIAADPAVQKVLAREAGK